jgi:hypothetical protein
MGTNHRRLLRDAPGLFTVIGSIGVLLYLPLEGPAMELDGCVGKVVEKVLLIHEVGPQSIEVLFKDGTTLRLNLAQRVGIEVSLDDGKSGEGSVPKKYPTAA